MNIYIYALLETLSNNFINVQYPFQFINLMSTVAKAYSKLKWTPDEQQLLRSLKEQKHIESWKIIANQMNQIFLQKNRSGKQCRERYMNYVRFGKELPKTSGWTPQEDEQLFLRFMKHGAKWVQIGKQMCGRSQNCLKNRFYGAMRKIIRKINRAAKEKRLRQKKPIKTELLIKILEYRCVSAGDENNCGQTLNFHENLKKQMIRIAINSEQNGLSEQIQSLITGILKFCALTKSPGGKKTQHKPKEQSEYIVEIQELSKENDEIKIQYVDQVEEYCVLYKIEQQIKKPKIVQNLILYTNPELEKKSQKLIEGLSLLQKHNNESNSTSGKETN